MVGLRRRALAWAGLKQAVGLAAWAMQNENCLNPGTSGGVVRFLRIEQKCEPSARTTEWGGSSSESSASFHSGLGWGGPVSWPGRPSFVNARQSRKSSSGVARSKGSARGSRTRPPTAPLFRSKGRGGAVREQAGVFRPCVRALTALAAAGRRPALRTVRRKLHPFWIQFYEDEANQGTQRT